MSVFLPTGAPSEYIMLKKTILRSYGINQKEFIKKFKETGDLGLTAEFFAKTRKQKSFLKKELTIDHVFDNIHKLTEIIGSGSQEKKMAFVVELLSHASSEEGKYIVRTIIGDMRIGVSHGIVRDAIAKAFDKEPKEIEKTWDVAGDFGRVAEMAREGKLNTDIKLFSPPRGKKKIMRAIISTNVMRREKSIIRNFVLLNI